MTRVFHFERTFTDHGEAERCFDSLQPTAWPYIWCMEIQDSDQWKVIALIEIHVYSQVA